MSTIKTRGPIGLGQDSSESDSSGPFLDVAGVPLHAGEPSRGPLGVSRVFANMLLDRSFFQQVSITGSQQTQTLTPVEFADLFHNIRVGYVDPRSGLAHSVTIDVHIYNNNGIDDNRANMAEKSALVMAVRRELRSAGGLALIDVARDHKFQIAHCFYGKGNPDEFKVTLMHALRYNRATPANLQQYCDRRAKLGVDCSGFVNTYFERIGRISAHRHINEYERGVLRSSENEIRDLDVLVWQGGSSRHIAVIDHVIAGSNPLRMVVVESAKSKHGLTASEYTVHGVNGQIFRVHRGGPGTGTSQVKIAQV